MDYEMEMIAINQKEELCNSSFWFIATLLLHSKVVCFLKKSYSNRFKTADCFAY
ncbi:MAG: hypothetical protein ACRCZY_02325 [Phocaeicola sp.]